MTAINEKICVTIHKCQFENHQFVCQPSVNVLLVDGRSGDSLLENADSGKIILTTRPCLTFSHDIRPHSPIWEESINCNYNFSEISVKKSTKLLLFFEICDIFEQRASNQATEDVEKYRVAWAFLKPVASDGSLNVNKPLRLQLFKIRKSCKISHQNCPVFHLYNDHDRKKYPGSLYITVKGAVPPNPSKRIERVETHNELEKGESPTLVSESQESPKIEVAKWSRLPTQSCKLPNTKISEFSISDKGASCLSFSHSGLFLACGTFSKVIIIDIIDRKRLTKFRGHTGLVYEMNWHNDDSLLLTLSADCTGMIWSIHPVSNAPLYILPHPSFVYCGKWFSDSTQLVTGGKDKTLRIWSQTAGKFDLHDEYQGHEGYITAVETSGATFMCSGDSLGIVLLWSFKENDWDIVRKLSLRETIGFVISNIHLHPGQRRIVITARTRGSVMVDVSAGVVVQAYKPPREAARASTCLTPCGSLFFNFSPNSNVNVWEFDSGKLISSYNNIFPDLSHCQVELGGSVVYHPFEHMAAFSVFGCNCPVVLLKYDRESDMSEELGLVRFEHSNRKIQRNSTTNGKREGNQTMLVNDKTDGGTATEDKLAAIVRNIDRILAAKKRITGTRSATFSEETSFEQLEAIGTQACKT